MFSDPDAFSAKSISGFSIDSQTNKLSDKNFTAVKFSNTIANVVKEFVDNNQYVVKETGLYYGNYSLRFGEGLTMMISSEAKIGVAISKTSTDQSVALLDHTQMGKLPSSEKETISLTQDNINHIYTLTAGDKLNFGVISSNVDLKSLGNISADITVYRIR